MRKPMMAGNWKMNKTPAEAVQLAQAIRSGLAKLDDADQVDCVVCPAFVCLGGVRHALVQSAIGVGAQTMHWEANGAFTGEVSPIMLQGLADYVIIGHSERRQYFAESDETVNAKVLAALEYGLTPILCVGESLAQNEAGETNAFVSSQVRAALKNVDAKQAAGIIVAYEPIWAIGTGKAATAEQAQTICGETVRGTLKSLYGDDVAQTMRILYGGSTNPKNIAEIMTQPDIDGALIGGASLQSESYVAMVATTAEVYAKA